MSLKSSDFNGVETTNFLKEIFGLNVFVHICWCFSSHVVKKKNPVAVKELIRYKIFDWRVHFLIVFCSAFFSLNFFLNLLFLPVFFYSLCCREMLSGLTSLWLSIEWMKFPDAVSLWRIVTKFMILYSSQKIYNFLRFSCSFRQIVTYSHHWELSSKSLFFK